MKLSLLGLFPLRAEGIAVASAVLVVLVVTSTDVGFVDELEGLSELSGGARVVSRSPFCVVFVASTVEGEVSCLGYGPNRPAATKSKHTSK